MLPALKDATVLAGILIGSFVEGLIPSRAARFFALNLPKPTKVTSPCFLSPSVIPSNTASQARPASAFDIFAFSATNSINSVFDITSTSHS